jgi:hypothetical protein
MIHRKVAAAIVATALGLGSFAANAARGDTTVVSVTQCGQYYCVETRTTYIEDAWGKLTVVSTTTRTYAVTNPQPRP